MRWFEGIRARLRLLFARRAAEERMDEEFRFHIEKETERLMREEGLDAREARRRALVAFGGVEEHKEALREGRGLAWLGGLSLDLKLGFRMLVKHPGLTLVACLALSVAIGGGATYLEFVNDLYHPTLPFEDGERIVGIRNWNVANGDAEDRSLHDFAVWREELESVENLGAFRPFERNLTTEDGWTEPVRGVEISASAFRVAGIPPLLGRPLVAQDEQAGAPPVVVLGHDLWQARFGEDPGVVGRTVRLGSEPTTVVGVMPAGFAFPINHGLWVPLRLDGSDYRRGEGPALTIFGRLAPGVELDAAQAELTAIGLRAAADFPETNQHLRPRIKPYVASLFSDRDDVFQRRMLYSLNLFFLALLGVCGANVATLVFARTATREDEITVRNALGASRGRVIAQLFAEALVLAAVAAVVGLTAAAFGSRWVKNVIAAAEGVPLPFWWDAGLAPATVLYTGVLTVLVAAIVGIVPALKATGIRLQARLRHATAGGSGMRFGGLWTGVIVAQVAITVIFLLTVVSVGWSVHVGEYGMTEFGFPAEEYLSVRFEMDREPPPSESTERARAEFRARFQATYRELERRLAAEPGVVGTTYAGQLPGMGHPWLPIEAEGMAAPPGADAATWVRTASVDVDFFDTFNAPIVSGRDFDARDLESGRNVVIVDQTFVREVMGGRNPIGVRVREAAVEREEPGPWYEVVGVVRDLTVGADKSAEDAVLYRPTAPGVAYPIHMAVHVRGDPTSSAPRLRNVAAAVDPTLRLHDLTPMDRIGRADRVAYGFFVRVLAIVGSIALLLSTAGVYSLMAFTVARRTREIGIRAALGADRRRILRGIFSPALMQVGLGVLAGSLPGGLLVASGALEVTRGGGTVVGVAASVAVAAFMLGIALLACVVPARRALRIPPSDALRVAG